MEKFNTLETLQDVLPVTLPSVTPSVESGMILAEAEDPSAFVESSRRRTLGMRIKRCFRSMKPGSLRGSIFVLVNSALGAGVLTLPYAMSQSGIILGILFLIFDATIAGFTSYILFSYVVTHKRSSYSSICNDILGPIAALLVDVCIALNGIGMCIAMCVFLGDYLPSIMAAFDAPAVLQDRSVLIALAMMLIWPMSIQPLVGKLKWLCFIIIAVLIGVCIIVILKAPSLYAMSIQHGTITWFNVDWSFATYYNIYLFAFSQHMNVCVIARELANPTDPRAVKVVLRSGFIEFLLYATLGIAGYISWLDEVMQDFINNYDASDVFVLLCRIFLSLMLLVSVPLNLIAACKSLYCLTKHFYRLFNGRLASRQNAPFNHYEEMLLEELSEERGVDNNVAPTGYTVTSNTFFEVEDTLFRDRLRSNNVLGEEFTSFLVPSVDPLEDTSGSLWFRVSVVTTILLCGFVVAIITDQVAVVVGYVGGILSSSIVWCAILTHASEWIATP